MISTLSLLVENSAGVLTRVSALISRRGFNINSLAVGECETKDLSRITIVVDCDEITINQMVAQLDKLVCVKKICVLQKDQAKSKELLLVKIQVLPNERNQIMQIADIFNAKIIDVTKTTMMLQITGNTDKVEAFLSLLDEYPTLEIARTGSVALAKGEQTIHYEN